MSEVVIGIIGIFVLLTLFLTGIELGFGMAIVGFVGFSYIVSLDAGLNLWPLTSLKPSHRIA